MIDAELLKARLGQYGTAWLLAFLIAFLGAAAGHGLMHLTLAAAADLLLMLLFAALGVATLWVVVQALVLVRPGSAKAVLVALAVLLLLPLLWSPVLALQAYARFTGAALEYSSVYAGFRITVGRALWGLTRLLFGSPEVQAAMRFLQGVSTLVGFAAACVQIWRVLVRPRTAQA
jgi:hypothetical protein